MILLDSDIAIDILRKHPPAIQWLVSVTDPVCLSGIVAFELYQGCYNKRDTEMLRQQLMPFALLWPSDAACVQVLADYANAHLAFAAGILDALIAATAITHGLPLNTFNQKHFAAFPQLKTVQPYTR
jgi:predicted nucleic acid-binding protein